MLWLVKKKARPCEPSIFDVSDQSFHIVHQRLQFGKTFKVLRCLFNSQLRMLEAAKHVGPKDSWRLKVVWRGMRHFTISK